jgi:hypothetical protein
MAQQRIAPLKRQIEENVTCEVAGGCWDNQSTAGDWEEHFQQRRRSALEKSSLQEHIRMFLNTINTVFKLLYRSLVNDAHRWHRHLSYCRRYSTSTSVILISEESKSDWKLSFRYQKSSKIDIRVHSDIRCQNIFFTLAGIVSKLLIFAGKRITSQPLNWSVNSGI